MSLEDILSRPKWMERAICRDMDTSVFFPEAGADTSDAKKVCKLCPVRRDCEQYGEDERYGIWGGVSRRENKVKLKKSNGGVLPPSKRQRAAPRSRQI